MSNCHCNSLSCGHHGPWRPDWCWGGCTAGDGTPACNPWAPWGRTGNDTACSCGRWGCTGCGNCHHWNNCGNACGTVAADTACDGCNTCGQWDSYNGAGLSGGCLVPRIISTGRAFQRRITQTLCIDDLPDCAESPMTLVSVTVSGQASWEQISECRQTLLRVTVPVVVQIRDCSGRCRTGHSSVTLTIPLCMNCPAQDFWRGQLFVAPCIRLAAPVTEDEDGCFDAPLEVQAEVFLVRMQVVNC